MRSSGTLPQLLTRLPEYFDRTPWAEDALQLTPIAPITVTISQHHLRTQVTNSGMSPIDVDLVPHTIQSLADYINAATLGYGAGVLGEGSASAATLVDVEDFSIEAAGQLPRFTSLLWALLSPIAWALDEAKDRISAGLQEFSERTADGLWLDRWGAEFYGGVLRKPGELDTAYAARIIREVTRWRVNGIAMEQILLEETGLQAVITTLHDSAWVIGRTGKLNAPLGYGFIAGRKYSRTTFEVVVDGVSDQIIEIIERNRAAGTLPFYAYRLVGGGPATATGIGATSYHRSTPAIGGDSIWTIGRDPLGFSIALSGNVEVEFMVVKGLLEDPVFGAGSAVPFVLGTSLLGSTDVLGSAGTGGMSITEDYSQCALF